MGTSCRNQRIERLWVHVNATVPEVYSRNFEIWTAEYPSWFPNGFGDKCKRCSPRMVTFFLITGAFNLLLLIIEKTFWVI